MAAESITSSAYAFRSGGRVCQQVLEAAREEHRPPTAAVVAAELEVVLLTRHARHDVTDPAPGVGVPMQQTQLGFVRIEREEAKRGTEQPFAFADHSSVYAARRSSAFTTRTAQCADRSTRSATLPMRS